MTLRPSAVLAVAIALALSGAGPALAARNTGISASLEKAMSATADAFCEGLSSWADAVEHSSEHSLVIPRTDREISDTRSRAQHIRDVGRSLGCLI